MESKEYEWIKKKIGVFSSSQLDSLMPGVRSDKWTDGNMTYLYSIQRQRTLNQPPPPVPSKTMQLGIDNEPYAVAWLRENTDFNIAHCSEDFEEKIFVKTEWGLGCSPDVYVLGNEGQVDRLIEIKTVAGASTTNFYFSPTVTHEKKRLKAFDEHKDQLAGQLCCFPSVDIIYILKYDPQIDEDPFDLRSPLDPTRGILFKYTRSEFGMYLDLVKERVMFADDYLKRGLDIDLINTEWQLFKNKQQNQNGTETSKNPRV